MNEGMDWAVAPIQGRTGRTLSLASALLLGRRHILAERLTLRWRVRLHTLAVWQFVLTLAGAWWACSMLQRSALPPAWRTGLVSWCLVSSVVVWAAHTWRVLGRIPEARRLARHLPVVLRTDGVCVYNPPLEACYERQLESCLSLGISPCWEGSLIGLGAPRLRRLPDQEEPAREWEFAHWLWTTQQAFEPGLLFSCGLGCLLTLNPFWAVYFTVAAVSLARSASIDRMWFDSVGRDRYRQADRDRQEFEEWRRQRRAAALEEERRRFLVQILQESSRPPVAIQDAFQKLPDDLRHILESDATESEGRDTSELR